MKYHEKMLIIKKVIKCIIFYTPFNIPPSPCENTLNVPVWDMQYIDWMGNLIRYR